MRAGGCVLAPAASHLWGRCQQAGCMAGGEGVGGLFPHDSRQLTTSCCLRHPRTAMQGSEKACNEGLRYVKAMLPHAAYKLKTSMTTHKHGVHTMVMTVNKVS